MSSLGSRCFFSFSSLLDQTKHREYAEWHGLDHLPENVALPGVALGRRWVRSPRCAAAGDPIDSELAAVQYLTTYWYREPVEQSIAQWETLASLSRHWGRRPELAWTKRCLRGFFVPTQGYVDRSRLVTADVLPFRPTRGVFVTVSRFAGPVADVVAKLKWDTEVCIPRLVECDGAAGAWTFTAADTFVQDRTATEMRSDRVVIVYLDDDPLEFTAQRSAVLRELRATANSRLDSPVETPLLSSPFETVIPWQWDWFDTPDFTA